MLFVPAVDFQCYDFYLMPLRFDLLRNLLSVQYLEMPRDFPFDS